MGDGLSLDLTLPNMLTAPAAYGFSRQLLGQLFFADGARFSHHVRHGPTPRLKHSMAGAGYKLMFRLTCNPLYRLMLPT
jgi:hypothetical protein